MGDFFRFATPPGFVDVWDAWLQRGIMAASDALGEAWRDTYMSAPIWRFTLSPGLAGPQAASGVMMPSVDRVGRLFPLTLVRPLSDGAAALAAHFAKADEFAALEEAALAALDDDMDREELEQRLAAIAQAGDAGAARLNGTPFDFHHAADTDPAHLIAAAGIGERLRAPSLWSSQTDAGFAFKAFDGLPGERLMVGLFHAPGQAEQGSVTIEPAV